MEANSGRRWLGQVLISSLLLGAMVVGEGVTSALAYNIGNVQTVAGSITLQSLACPSSATCYAVGGNGSSGVFVTIPTSGTAPTIQVVAGTVFLNGLACPSSGTCYAVGNNVTDIGDSVGVVVTIPTDGMAPSVQTIAEANDLYGLACPSGSTCYAAGGNRSAGMVVAIPTDGTGLSTQAIAGTAVLNDIACPTSSLCYAVGGTGSSALTAPTGTVTIVPTDGSAPSTQAVPGTFFLWSIGCFNATCYAVGNNDVGNTAAYEGVVVPIPADGGTMSVQPVEGTYILFGLACLSSTTCYAVGQDASDSGVVAPSMNESPDSTQTVAGASALIGVACPNDTACYAVGQNVSNVGVVVPIITQMDTTSNVSTSANPAIVGQMVAITATVVPQQGTGIPTGTVAFYDGDAELGSATLNQGSPDQATIQIASLAVGSHSITVVYQGDSSFTESTSGVMAQVIAYNICLLFDPTQPKQSGSTLPIQLQLCDAGGANVSAAGIVVHAVSVDGGPPQSPGNSQPGNNFTYSASLGGTGGYQFNLQTTGLASGTHSFTYTAGSDPSLHTIQFQIK